MICGANPILIVLLGEWMAGWTVRGESVVDLPYTPDRSSATMRVCGDCGVLLWLWCGERNGAEEESMGESSAGMRFLDADNITISIVSTLSSHHPPLLPHYTPTRNHLRTRW